MRVIWRPSAGFGKFSSSARMGALVYLAGKGREIGYINLMARAPPEDLIHAGQHFVGRAAVRLRHFIPRRKRGVS